MEHANKIACLNCLRVLFEYTRHSMTIKGFNVIRDHTCSILNAFAWNGAPQRENLRCMHSPDKQILRLRILQRGTVLFKMQPAGVAYLNSHNVGLC